MSEEATPRCCGTSDLQNMPMKRYTNPIPSGEEPEECSDCECARELKQILEALACQNQLLVDLLGAVNCLTAACLTRGHT